MKSSGVVRTAMGFSKRGDLSDFMLIWLTFVFKIADPKLHSFLGLVSSFSSQFYVAYFIEHIDI